METALTRRYRLDERILVRKLTGLVFRVDQPAIDDHVKDSIPSWNQDGIHGKGLLHPRSQTDRRREIVSDCAVLDRNVHEGVSPPPGLTILTPPRTDEWHRFTIFPIPGLTNQSINPCPKTLISARCLKTSRQEESPQSRRNGVSMTTAPSLHPTGRPWELVLASCMWS